MFRHTYPSRSEPDNQNIINHIQPVFPPNLNVIEDGKYTDEPKGLPIDIRSYEEIFVFSSACAKEPSHNEVGPRAVCTKMEYFTSR